MVTSTSTPGSMEMEVICLTISEGECKSIKRLWILISKRSKVSEPLPQGDLRVVIRRTLVGRRTGPLTLSCLSLARWIRSLETFSRFLTLREVKVIRIRWILNENVNFNHVFHYNNKKLTWVDLVPQDQAFG